MSGKAISGTDSRENDRRMTSATEELRRLLDERGVNWGNIRNDGSESDYLTEWQLDDRQGHAVAIEWVVGGGLSMELHRHNLTPEQAIAATLDAGTCKNRDADIYPGGMVFVCSACEGMSTDGQPSYCPNCGRKVVE